MANNIEHLFMYLSAIYISSLVKYLFMSFAHCLIYFLVSYCCFDNNLYILDTSSSLDICFSDMFSTAHSLSFHPLNGVSGRAKVLNSEVQFINFSFHGLCFYVKPKNSLPRPLFQRSFPLSSYWFYSFILLLSQ